MERAISKDETLKRDQVNRYSSWITEYELIKKGEHKKYRFVKDFYEDRGICHQNFSKYYNRYKQSGDTESLVPQRRGPKYLSRRIDISIENRVVEIRKRGLNKYEIHDILSGELGEKTPSVSCIYAIFQRNNMNRLQPKQKVEKRRIIREKAGELAHIDCHYLNKNLIFNANKRYFLVGVVDDQSRTAWVEVVNDIKSLTVMFATMRCFNHIKRNYKIEFLEAITDNGSEFGIKTSAKKEGHPFEKMLLEMGIKHRYTKPYRPQTNGKIERFWRTLNDDLINETYFESIEHFKEELLKYIIYYNEIRPHQALNGLQPYKSIVI